MKHLAVIMDGNGRWAERKDLPRTKGHEQGALALLQAIKDFQTSELEYISFYAFSTENENRNSLEAASILGIITYFLEHGVLPLVQKFSLRVRFIGDLKRLPSEVVSVISMLNAAALNNTGKTVVFAIGYGGRAEVCAAMDKLMKQRMFAMDDSPVREEELINALYTVHIPDPDAVLRYGGYRRLSNFLPIQTVYSELFFIDTLWPDYNYSDIETILNEFRTIQRNFGGNNA